MKKTNKKGFTIVELVIVIAVIAILSAVLIPTFGGVIADAQNSAALQAARQAQTKFLSDKENAETLKKDSVIIVYDAENKKYYGNNTDGEFEEILKPAYSEANIIITLNGVKHTCADTAHPTTGTNAAHNGKCDICDDAVNCETDGCTYKPTATPAP